MSFYGMSYHKKSNANSSEVPLFFKKAVNSLQINKSASLIITGSEDGSVKLIDPKFV